VLSHPAHFFAFGFGAGLVRPGPGTAGTLVAFPLFWVLDLWMNATGYALLLPALFVAGAWACGRTGEALGVHDHGGLVIDEIVAFLAVLVLIPRDPAWQTAGFVLFRFFDIVKPQPIGFFDRTVKGGLGVMFDDLLAAAFTLGLLGPAGMLVAGAG
jgi:phosphatidylglycerophosphatase A